MSFRGLRGGRGRGGSRGRGIDRLKDKSPDTAVPSSKSDCPSSPINVASAEKEEARDRPNRQKKNTRSQSPSHRPTPHQRKLRIEKPSNQSSRTNDPSALAGFERVEGLVMQPASARPSCSQSAAGFVQLAERLYDELCSVGRTWRREISRSMFEYYLAIFYHAKQADNRAKAGRTSIIDEGLTHLVLSKDSLVPESLCIG